MYVKLGEASGSSVCVGRGVRIGEASVSYISLRDLCVAIFESVAEISCPRSHESRGWFPLRSSSQMDPLPLKYSNLERERERERGEEDTDYDSVY